MTASSRKLRQNHPSLKRPWPGLDRLGLTQAIGGLVLGLIALFSSYDHITVAGRTLPLQQQWGIPFIAASVAISFCRCSTGDAIPSYEQRTR